MGLEKALKPHELRVVEEEKELREKSYKLGLFIESEVYQTLDEKDKELILGQFQAMELYRYFLKERIERFK